MSDSPTFDLGVQPGFDLDRARRIADDLEDDEIIRAWAEDDVSRFPGLRWINPLTEGLRPGTSGQRRPEPS